MGALLAVSRAIDGLNQAVGRVVGWLILVAVLVSAGNAVSRYALSVSSNAYLELQWYLFAAVFMLCAGYTLLRNEHIRIDVLAGRFSPRTQAWIDVLGTLFFLLPFALLALWLAWPVFWRTFESMEQSSNAGGLIRWPVWLTMPVGFALLLLQALSELIKRIAFLAGVIEAPVPAGSSGPHAPPQAADGGA